MCSLYSNTLPVVAMRQLFKVEASRDQLGNAEPMPAIFPKRLAPIVALDSDSERVLWNAHWGFVMPRVSKVTGEPIQPKAINNARDDKLRTSAFWKNSFAERRCLIPATSFCEAKGRKSATYVWFGLRGEGERPPFALAGIWRTFRGDYGGEQREIVTFSMITTTPNELVADTHPDRMPAILHPDNYETWLAGQPKDAFNLIRPYPAEKMVIHQRGEGLRADQGDL